MVPKLLCMLMAGSLAVGPYFSHLTLTFVHVKESHMPDTLHVHLPACDLHTEHRWLCKCNACVSAFKDNGVCVTPGASA